MSTCVVKSHGPLHHRRWDTQPSQHHGMIEETWVLGPFEARHHYVRENRRYGSWSFSFSLALRRWYGPYLTIGVGSGAQDWEADERWWKGEDG
jgi:hypothetical protein